MSRGGGLLVAYWDVWGVWPLLSDEFHRRAVTERTIWASPDMPAPLLLRELPLAAVRADDPLLTFPDEDINWYRRPYVHVLCVRLEEEDTLTSGLGSARGSRGAPATSPEAVKAYVRAWVDKMTAAKAEWFVVYVPQPSGKAARSIVDTILAYTGTKKFSGTSLGQSFYSTTFNMLRTECGGRKHAARFVRLDEFEVFQRTHAAPPSATGSGAHVSASRRISNVLQPRKRREDGDAESRLPPLDAETREEIQRQWSDFMSRMNTAVFNALNARVAAHMHVINDILLNSNVEGWNFCKYFCMHESLALIYEQIGLGMEALKCYQMIAQKFEQVAQPPPLPTPAVPGRGFGGGALEAPDSAIPLDSMPSVQRMRDALKTVMGISDRPMLAPYPPDLLEALYNENYHEVGASARAAGGSSAREEVYNASLLVASPTGSAPGMSSPPSDAVSRLRALTSPSYSPEAGASSSPRRTTSSGSSQVARKLTSAYHPTPSVFDLTQKPYRQLVYVGEISLFDFQHYLYVRQCTLLKTIPETRGLAMAYSIRFVEKVLDMMAAYKLSGRLNVTVARAWVYCACLDILEQVLPKTTPSHARHRRRGASESAQRRPSTANMLPPPAAVAAVDAVAPGGEPAFAEAQQPAATPTACQAPAAATLHTQQGSIFSIDEAHTHMDAISETLSEASIRLESGSEQDADSTNAHPFSDNVLRRAHGSHAVLATIGSTVDMLSPSAGSSRNRGGAVDVTAGAPSVNGEGASFPRSPSMEEFNLSFRRAMKDSDMIGLDEDVDELGLSGSSSEEEEEEQEVDAAIQRAASCSPSAKVLEGTALSTYPARTQLHVVTEDGASGSGSGVAVSAVSATDMGSSGNLSVRASPAPRSTRRARHALFPHLSDMPDVEEQPLTAVPITSLTDKELLGVANATMLSISAASAIASPLTATPNRVSSSAALDEMPSGGTPSAGSARGSMSASPVPLPPGGFVSRENSAFGPTQQLPRASPTPLPDASAAMGVAVTPIAAPPPLLSPPTASLSLMSPLPPLALGTPYNVPGSAGETHASQASMYSTGIMSPGDGAPPHAQGLVPVAPVPALPPLTPGPRGPFSPSTLATTPSSAHLLQQPSFVQNMADMSNAVAFLFTTARQHLTLVVQDVLGHDVLELPDLTSTPHRPWEQPYRMHTSSMSGGLRARTRSRTASSFDALLGSRERSVADIHSPYELACIDYIAPAVARVSPAQARKAHAKAPELQFPLVEASAEAEAEAVAADAAVAGRASAANAANGKALCYAPDNIAASLREAHSAAAVTLAVALLLPDEADRLYAALTFQAAEYFGKAGRSRRAHMLWLERATVLIRHHEYGSALSLLLGVERITHGGWADLAAWCVTLTAACQYACGLFHDFIRNTWLLLQPTLRRHAGPWATMMHSLVTRLFLSRSSLHTPAHATALALPSPHSTPGSGTSQVALQACEALSFSVSKLPPLLVHTMPALYPFLVSLVEYGQRCVCTDTPRTAAGAAGKSCIPWSSLLGDGAGGNDGSADAAADDTTLPLHLLWHPSWQGNRSDKSYLHVVLQAMQSAAMTAFWLDKALAAGVQSALSCTPASTAAGSISSSGTPAAHTPVLGATQHAVLYDRQSPVELPMQPLFACTIAVVGPPPVASWLPFQHGPELTKQPQELTDVDMHNLLCPRPPIAGQLMYAMVYITSTLPVNFFANAVEVELELDLDADAGAPAASRDSHSVPSAPSVLSPAALAANAAARACAVNAHGISPVVLPVDPNEWTPCGAARNHAHPITTTLTGVSQQVYASAAAWHEGVVDQPPAVVQQRAQAHRSSPWSGVTYDATSFSEHSTSSWVAAPTSSSIPVYKTILLSSARNMSSTFSKLNTSAGDVEATPRSLDQPMGIAARAGSGVRTAGGVALARAYSDSSAPLQREDGGAPGAGAAGSLSARRGAPGLPPMALRSTSLPLATVGANVPACQASTPVKFSTLVLRPGLNTLALSTVAPQVGRYRVKRVRIIAGTSALILTDRAPLLLQGYTLHQMMQISRLAEAAALAREAAAEAARAAQRALNEDIIRHGVKGEVRSTVPTPIQVVLPAHQASFQRDATVATMQPQPAVGVVFEQKMYKVSVNGSSATRAARMFTSPQKYDATAGGVSQAGRVHAVPDRSFQTIATNRHVLGHTAPLWLHHLRGLRIHAAGDVCMCRLLAPQVPKSVHLGVGAGSAAAESSMDNNSGSSSSSSSSSACATATLSALPSSLCISRPRPWTACCGAADCPTLPASELAALLANPFMRQGLPIPPSLVSAHMHVGLHPLPEPALPLPKGVVLDFPPPPPAATAMVDCGEGDTLLPLLKDSKRIDLGALDPTWFELLADAFSSHVVVYEREEAVHVWVKALAPRDGAPDTRPLLAGTRSTLSLLITPGRGTLAHSSVSTKLRLALPSGCKSAGAATAHVFTPPQVAAHEWEAGARTEVRTCTADDEAMLNVLKGLTPSLAAPSSSSSSSSSSVAGNAVDMHVSPDAGVVLLVLPPLRHGQYLRLQVPVHVRQLKRQAPAASSAARSASAPGSPLPTAAVRAQHTSLSSFMSGGGGNTAVIYAADSTFEPRVYAPRPVDGMKTAKRTPQRRRRGRCDSAGCPVESGSYAPRMHPPLSHILRLALHVVASTASPAGRHPQRAGLQALGSPQHGSMSPGSGSEAAPSSARSSRGLDASLYGRDARCEYVVSDPQFPLPVYHAFMVHTSLLPAAPVLVPRMSADQLRRVVVTGTGSSLPHGAMLQLSRDVKHDERREMSLSQLLMMNLDATATASAAGGDAGAPDAAQPDGSPRVAFTVQRYSNGRVMQRTASAARLNGPDTMTPIRAPGPAQSFSSGATGSPFVRMPLITESPATPARPTLHTVSESGGSLLLSTDSSQPTRSPSSTVGEEEEDHHLSGGAVLVQQYVVSFVPRSLRINGYSIVPPATSGWTLCYDGSRGLVGTVIPFRADDVSHPPPVLAFAYKFKRSLSASNSITARFSIEYCMLDEPGTDGMSETGEAFTYYDDAALSVV